MRVLVTGAGGFVGSHTVERLAARGHAVIATARARRDAPLQPPTQWQLRAADLASDPLDDLIAGCDAVVHCAARASPWGKRAEFWRDNVIATVRLLEAARRAGTVGRLVFLSSPSIYFQYADQLDRSEEFTPPSRWPTFYAETKWAAECRVRAALDLNPIILRPRAVFGPGDRAIVPRLIAVAQKGFFPMPNGGRAWVDVTFIDNVVDAVERALGASDDQAGRAFNITNGEPLQVKDLLTKLFAALQLPVRLLSLPIPLASLAARISEGVATLRPGQPEPRLTRYGIGLLAYSQTLSIEAAKSALRYAPRVSVSDGLERCARWWRSSQ